MNRNWSRVLVPILVLFVTLMVSHVAFARHHGGGGDDDDVFSGPSAAPEIDPRLVIEGLAVAGGAAVLVWERIRRRR